MEGVVMATLQQAIAELELAYTATNTDLMLTKIELVRTWLRDMADEQRDLETGLAGWRTQAESHSKQAHMAKAQTRVTLAHLDAVLNKAKTANDQQAIDTAARDYLASIGYEPS
jgi:hypothetical protein